MQHAGKMNTGKKHFDLTSRNGVAGTREVSKGGPGGLPLAHDFALQSLVCYTFVPRRTEKVAVAMKDSSLYPDAGQTVLQFCKITRFAKTGCPAEETKWKTVCSPAEHRFSFLATAGQRYIKNVSTKLHRICQKRSLSIVTSCR